MTVEASLVFDARDNLVGMQLNSSLLAIEAMKVSAKRFNQPALPQCLASSGRVKRKISRH